MKKIILLTVVILFNFFVIESVAQTIKGSAIPKTASDLLKKMMNDAGVTEVTVTNTNRTATEQVRVMYEAIEKTSVEAQKKLYGIEGDAVIDVYVASKAAGKTKEEIQADMLAELIRQLPSAMANNRLMHIGREEDFIVFDLDMNRVLPATKLETFKTKLRAAETAKTIHRFLDPTNGEKDALHIEIKK